MNAGPVLCTTAFERIKQLQKEFLLHVSPLKTKQIFRFRKCPSKNKQADPKNNQMLLIISALS